MGFKDFFKKKLPEDLTRERAPEGRKGKGIVFQELSPAQVRHDRQEKMRDLSAQIREVRDAKGDAGEEIALEKEAQLTNLQYEDAKDRIGETEMRVFSSGDAVRVPFEKAGEAWQVGVVDEESGNVTIVEEATQQMRSVDGDDLNVWQNPAGRFAWEQKVTAVAGVRNLQSEREDFLLSRAKEIAERGSPGTADIADPPQSVASADLRVRLGYKGEKGGNDNEDGSGDKDK